MTNPALHLRQSTSPYFISYNIIDRGDYEVIAIAKERMRIFSIQGT